MGSALMLFSTLHLTLGNVVIGLVEGLVLRLAYRVPTKRAVPQMIAANFGSMIVGALVVYGCASVAGIQSLAPGAVFVWLAVAIVVFWAATVVIEWPFVAWAMKDRAEPDRDAARARWRRALRASLVLQTASYVVMVLLYATVSPISVLTQTTAADAGDIAALVPSAANVRVWFRTGDDAGPCWTVPLTGGAPAPTSEPRERVAPESRWRGTDEAADLSGGAWHVTTGFWAAQGLTAENSVTHERVRVALETPFLAWLSRDATVLPGGVVVYALGPHVVSLDLATRRLAVLAEGRDPVVVIEGDPR